MKKDNPQKKRSLSREEMINRHQNRNYQDTGNELNAFSRRALSGLQYHPDGTPLEDTLGRLDRRINAAARRSFPIRRILSIAAAATILLTAGYFLFLKPPAPEAVFAQHFDYLPSAVNTRGGARNEAPSSYDQASGIRARAMQAYEAGRYEQARPLLETHLAENGRDSELRLYLGIVLLGEGDAALAIQQLQTVLDKLPRADYERAARWYLGLAYLRNGQMEKARSGLEKLQRGTDRYAKSARAVLEKL